MEFLATIVNDFYPIIMAALTLGIKEFAQWYKDRKKRANLINDVAYIKGQLTLNGGSTLRDEILQLRENQNLTLKRWQMQTHGLQHGVYESDTNGECIFVNKFYADLVGMEKQEMLGKGWLKSVAPEERELIWDNWKHSIDNEIPYEATYTIINQITKKKIRVKANAEPYKSLKGKSHQYYGTIEILTN